MRGSPGRDILHNRGGDVVINERNNQDGFHGWVKWVVVIAALFTITDAIYSGTRGLIDGYRAAVARPR
jgi:hypothetical protein